MKKVISCCIFCSVLSMSMYAATIKDSVFLGVYGGGNVLSKDYKGSIDTIIGGQIGFEFYDKNQNTIGLRTYFDTGHTLGAYWYDVNPSVQAAFHSYNINADAIVRPISWLSIFLGVGVGYHNLVINTDSIHSAALFVNAGLIAYLSNHISLELRIRASGLSVDVPSGHFNASRNGDFTLGVNFVF